MRVELTKEQIENLGVLMNRVTLTGNEAHKFLELMNIFANALMEDSAQKPKQEEESVV